MAGRDVQAAGALLTADGTSSGYITVLNSLPFRIGARAWLSATGVTKREIIIVAVSIGGQIGVRYVDAPGTGVNYGLSDVSVYTIALAARIDMPAQLIDQDLVVVDIVRQSALLECDVTPRQPLATDYLPVRLTDGSSFYTASGGGGGGGGTSSSYGAAFPTQGTAGGFTDGINMQGATVFDEDTGPGAQYVLGVSLRKAGLGGSVEFGTGTDPVRVDPTGVTTQPVSIAGTVAISAVALPLPTGAATAANQTTLGVQTTKINDGVNTAAVTAASALKVDGSAVTQPVSAASLPLPTGAATEATLATRLADATFTSRINTLGQKTSANSTPVVLASDQSEIPVTLGTSTFQNGSQVAIGVGATLILPANASRKSAIISNVGIYPVVIGTTGVTATTGYSLPAGGVMILSEPHIPINAIYGIQSSGAVTVFAQESV